MLNILKKIIHHIKSLIFNEIEKVMSFDKKPENIDKIKEKNVLVKSKIDNYWI